MTDEFHNEAPTPAYRLGDFVLDMARGELRHAILHTGFSLSLRSQRVLYTLLTRAGEVVTNEELLACIPDGSKAGVNAIQKCVTELRAALGDSRTEPRYIETVTKRGYRLLVRPEELAPEPRLGGTNGTPAQLPSAHPGTAATKSGLPPAPSRLLTSIAGAAVLILAGVAFWLAHPGATTTPAHTPPTASTTPGTAHPDAAAVTSIGLATIHCQPENAATKRLCDRMADLVKGGLDRMGGVRVVPAPRRMGPEARVTHTPAYILDLSLAQSSDQVEVLASLHEAASNSRVYMYSGADELPTAEEHLPRHAATVLSAVEVHLNPALRAEMRASGTHNVDAYRAWAMGYYLHFPIGIQRLTVAARHAERAIELDPGFVAAYGNLQQAVTIEGRIQTDELQRRRLREVARDISDKLSRVDPTSSELIALRTLRLRLGGATPRRLEEDARASIEQSRGMTCECYLDYADLLIGARLFSEAERLLQTPVARNSTSAWQYRRRELITLLREGPAVALRRRDTLGGFRNNVVLLALVLPLLQAIGDNRTADAYQTLLEDHDGDGYWATFGRLQREYALARTGVYVANPTARTQPATDALVRGVLHFMRGDVTAGVKDWQHLDSRMLQHLAWYLPVHELSFPPQVLRAPGYRAMLEELDIGARWAEYLRMRATELGRPRHTSRKPAHD